MIKIDSIKVSAKKNIDIKKLVSDKYKLKKIDGFKILKKSLDARNKDIQYIYSIALKTDLNLEKELVKRNKNIDFYKPNNYQIPSGPIKENVCIVGFGPAGIFAAYLLANKGFKPVIIERGEPIELRTKTVNSFWNNSSQLNEESNVQFGEGGAGTFSDGKLNTGVKDKEGRINYILDTFVKHGAKENITYDSKPHVGTDVLANVIVSMREEIIKLGGTILFNHRFDSCNIENNAISSINCTDTTINKNINIKCDKLILAIGHSSRDTFKYLNTLVSLEQKPFAMGYRVIHPQTLINESQYGEDYSEFYENLPECSYKLTYQTKDNRGVYSFCMCPGGYVVNASSEEGRTCVNGMSYNDRASGYANSAIIVQIRPEDLDSNDSLAGMYLQQRFEENAYKLGRGSIPVCRLNDLFDFDYNESQIIIEDAIKGEYLYTNKVKEIFSDDINECFVEGMKHFDKIINNFASSNPYIAGVEARTSSPIKILRNENFESSIKGIYPCGEGAGYAGGIISAAIDGMKVAEQIIKE